MSDLMPFWRLLETRVSRMAVMVEWQRTAGLHFPVVRPWLQPTGELSSMYPSTYGALRVTQHADGVIVGVHPRDWEKRQILEHSDIVLYRIDWAKARKMICGTLGIIQISRPGMETSPYRLFLGHWEPRKSVFVPVFLLLCPQQGILEQELFQIATKHAPGGALVLTPTRSHWHESVANDAQHQKLLLAPLSEIIDSATTPWVPTSAWEEYLTGFAAKMLETKLATIPPKKSIPTRGIRLANIEKLERELEQHLISARAFARNKIDAGLEPALLPKPTQTELGERVGLVPADVSRCLHDKRATVLQLLWNTADSLEQILRFKPRR